VAFPGHRAVFIPLLLPDLFLPLQEVFLAALLFFRALQTVLETDKRKQQKAPRIQWLRRII